MFGWAAKGSEWIAEERCCSRPVQQQEFVAPVLQVSSASSNGALHWDLGQRATVPISAPGISNANQRSSRRWRSTFKGTGRQARVKGQSLTQRNNLLSLECQILSQSLFFGLGGGRQKVPYKDPYIYHTTGSNSHSSTPEAHMACILISVERAHSVWESLFCPVPVEDVASRGLSPIRLKAGKEWTCNTKLSGAHDCRRKLKWTSAQQSSCIPKKYINQYLKKSLAFKPKHPDFRAIYLTWLLFSCLLSFYLEVSLLLSLSIKKEAK